MSEILDGFIDVEGQPSASALAVQSDPGRLALTPPSVPDFSGYITPPPSHTPDRYFQMPEDQYHSFPAISAGLLKQSTQAEMFFNRTQPPDASDSNEALVLGSLTHAVILEPWKFGPDHWEKHFALCPTKGLGTKQATEARNEAANAGKLLVTPELLTTAMRIRHEGIDTNPTAVKLLNSKNGMKEATGIVWDKENGCRRKWRIDYLPMNGPAVGILDIGGLVGSYVLDVKTTRHPLPRFEHAAWSLGYYGQCAWYLDCHRLLTGQHLDYWVWLVVTNTEPFMSKLFVMKNLRPNDPMYQGSKIQIARESLGLDPSGKLSRITQFLTAAREYESLRRGGETDMRDVALLRRIWAAYENEDIQLIY